MRNRWFIAALLALAFASPAMAQDPAAGYPNRPLRFIVP